MNYTSSGGTEVSTDPAFAAKVKELSGINIDRCYQCLTCSLGCPVASAMDYRPNQVLRMTQLGLKNQVLQSATIWLCASCEACVTRCPNEIDLPRVMDTLRQIALQEKVSGKGGYIPLFHRIFINNIWRWGRQYELGLSAELELRTLKQAIHYLFSDMKLGINMLRRRKLIFLPMHFKTLPVVRDIRNTFGRL